MIPPRQPKPAPPSLTLSKLLVVEGDTPMHFCEALLRHLNLEKDIEIRSFGGVRDFALFIGDLARSHDFRGVVSMGVIRDAESNPVAARQSVESALQAAGLTPARLPPIKTSIFILPDNASPGMIETLCMLAADSEPGLAGACACTADFFACLAKKGIALPAEPKLSKNRAQAYLATRVDAQLFPGQASYRGHWPFDNAVFDPLKQFLQAL